jgi:hypothetical protein
MIKKFVSLIKSSSVFRISFVILVTSLLTLFFTYPLIHYIKYRSIGHLDDPKLNMWIINWGCHQLLNKPLKLYQANAFYPYRNSLAFADNLVGLSIISLPAYILSKNPILVYNTALLASFILIGIGIYLLVYRLTGNFYAAIMAAVIYNFCPGHLLRYSQIQLFATQWTIFALLYLHKFMEKSSSKNMLLLTFFFVLQAVSGAYNAIYLGLIIGFGIIFFTVAKKKHREKYYFIKLVTLMLLCVSLSFILFLPYLQVRKEYGLNRSLNVVEEYSPNWQTYLAVPTNFYQKIDGASPWLKETVFEPAKTYLFPGLIPIILASLSFFLLLGQRKRNSKNREYKISSEQLFYLVIAIVFAIFSTGTHLPLYKLIYKGFIFFKLIRVPSRMFLITILSLSILSGYGIARILTISRKKTVIYLVAILIPLLFFIECAVYPPIPWPGMPYTSVPPVYKWLEKQTENFAVAEMPFDVKYANTYMLFSTFHWKNLVNGRSGFEPKDYLILEKRLKKFPFDNSLDRLHKIVGLRYIIIHSELYPEEEWLRIHEKLTELQREEKIKLIKKIGDDYVYTLL